jgi:DNA (cytosine-5)-methyltransferase 1
MEHQSLIAEGYLTTKSLDEIEEQNNRKPTHISLFTGIGGFDLGFSKAGFENRVMVEFNKDCCDTLRVNWLKEYILKREDYVKNPCRKLPPHYQEREPVILERDITTLTTKEILDAGNLEVGEATVLSGGCPCQGFSTANTKTRVINNPKNFLYKEMVRVVKEALPRNVIFENVPGLVWMDKGAVIKQICEDFASVGYNVAWDILNAADYGVPQNRKRVILVAKRVDLLIILDGMNPRLHMGACKGEITHPDWFINKMEKQNKKDKLKKD